MTKNPTSNPTSLGRTSTRAIANTDGIDRRGLLRTGLLAAVGTAALGASAPARAEQPTPQILHIWPGDPPGGTDIPIEQKITPRGPGAYDRVIDRVNPPTLAVFRPEHPTGAAFLLAQGGGYVHIAQGTGVAQTLNDAGITVFDLSYRLPGDGWRAGPDAPLQDAIRALRLIRAHADHYNVDPKRIGVMGFSAGGHVAASLATRFADKVYSPADGADIQSARPDFAVLSCPVITMTAPFAHGGSKAKLLGANPTAEQIETTSCEKRVTTNTPPCFLVHADDDHIVPADNSLLMASALRRAHVPCELHLYREGGHGMGTNLPKDLPAATWPGLMLAWMARYGYLNPTTTP